MKTFLIDLAIIVIMWLSAYVHDMDLVRQMKTKGYINFWSTETYHIPKDTK